MKKLTVNELLKSLSDLAWVRIINCCTDPDIEEINDLYIGKAANIFDNLRECKVITMYPDFIIKETHPDVFGTGNDDMARITLLVMQIE